jgi:site-specific recombinase
MADRLHKFIPLHEILQQAGRFHDKASRLLASWAREPGSARAGSFFELAARHEREVAESLAARLAADQDLASAETFYQNPPETIPSEGDLQTLAAHKQDVDALAAGLHDLHERWVTVYNTLQATNSTRHVSELIASCRELIERLERQLSSAQVQLQDM